MILRVDPTIGYFRSSSGLPMAPYPPTGGAADEATLVNIVPVLTLESIFPSLITILSGKIDPVYFEIVFQFLDPCPCYGERMLWTGFNMLAQYFVSNVLVFLLFADNLPTEYTSCTP